MKALDLETSPVQGDLSNGYALEPWRVRQGKAFISSIAVVGDDGFPPLNLERPTAETLCKILEDLQGQEVYCHNATFDIAWQIASIEPNKTARLHHLIRGVRWRDTQLLAKWVANGQMAEDMQFSYSLVNLVNSFLDDRPGTPEFVAMKQGMTLNPDDPYWLKRGLMDAEKTLELAHFLEEKLKPEQRRGFIIEQRNLAFIANSWLIGVRVNEKKLDEAERYYISERDKHIAESGLPVTAEMLASPKQLGNLLYNQLQMPVIARTPTGAPSCAGDTIKLLAYKLNDDKLKKLVRAKECVTNLSKYVKTAREALDRTGDGYMYGVPKIFGTNTGRFTMSNETLKGQKVSIAMHQIPRKEKMIRAYMEPPEGFMLREEDAMAQESRIMGIWSRDENLLGIFKKKIDPHAWMASEIYGEPWQTIRSDYLAGAPAAYEKRQNGKLVNLACNFRIGGASLAKKSFTEYDRYMEEQEGRYLVNVFKRAYDGVPNYWNSILNFARSNGYTYTLAQRRFKTHKWDGEAWKSEGIAISHPIQGTAAEHLHGAMTAVHDHLMITTLHDATFFAVESEEESREIDAKMNSVDFQALWNVELPIDLPFEGKTGSNFAEVK